MANKKEFTIPHSEELSPESLKKTGKTQHERIRALTPEDYENLSEEMLRRFALYFRQLGIAGDRDAINFLVDKSLEFNRIHGEEEQRKQLEAEYKQLLRINMGLRKLGLPLQPINEAKYGQFMQKDAA